MRCPRCNQDIEDNWFCPFCGFEISDDNSENIAEPDNIVNEEESEINEQNISLEENYIPIDNNPFSFTGRIKRLPYFLILIVLWIFSDIFNYIKNLFVATLSDTSYYLFYVCYYIVIILLIVTFFAMIKRLRDIKWNPWLCLLIFVPAINYAFGLILLFIKSQYEDTANQI